jgi:acyl-CoA dehydrogenase family protein 9
LTEAVARKPTAFAGCGQGSREVIVSPVVEAATTTQPTPPQEGVSSFGKSLFCGEIHEDLVFPYPKPHEAEEQRIRSLIGSLRAFAAESIDPKKIESERWIGDDVVAGLGELGLCGLYVPQRYGGQGLSQTGYCRVFETFAQIDATVSVVMGVHQSIGMKGIVLFGSDEQKERFLPDLAAGRKLAGFALTEPNAGSDAFNIESRAVREADGSWRLNGEKRYIGNAGRGSVFVTFARTEIEGKDRHTAFILEKGMEGFETGERYDTMGLRGNDLRPLYFKEVRIPPENVLGEPGEGFHIAMHILNNGRLSLGTGSVGAAKWLLDEAIDHVTTRRQFGHPLADFELVQEKIGWMVSYLFGLESMAYLTTGLVDAGVPDYSIESAICKVAGTEFLWYQANRALQLKGGAGYMRDQPYEKVLRDIRIFPIFEGANDVLRAFIALTGMKPLSDRLSGLAKINFTDPIHSLGVLAEYVGERIQREVRPDRVTLAHAELSEPAAAVSDQVKQLREVCESLLRRERKNVMERQFHQKRLADAVADIYAQIAVLSRVTSIFEDHGVELSAQERYIADTFCARAAGRVRSRFDQLEHNDDERISAIARLAYKRGAYGYAFFED